MISQAVVLDIETSPSLDVEQWLPPVEPDKAMTEELNAPIEAAKNLVDPAKIAADIARKMTAKALLPAKIAADMAEAQAKQVARASLFPWTCRIVALGMWPVEQPAPRVYLTPTEADEAAALKAFWAVVVDHASGYVRPIVSYNGLAFDLLVLQARSRLLGVQAPVLNIDKYRSPHPDLLQILTFRGAIPARSLTWFAKRFGLVVTDETSGADIGALVAAGNYEAVRAHCTSDLETTHALAVRLGLIQAAATAAREVA